jgi:hypothetical protein
MDYYRALSAPATDTPEDGGTDWYAALNGRQAPAGRWAIDPETGREMPGIPAGAPVRSARTADRASPVVQAMGQPIAEGGAGLATTAAASLSTDREQQRRIIAARLFPRMPIEQALARVSYGDDGRLYAVGDDGAPRYVEPRSVLAAGGQTPGNIARATAGLAGSVPAAVGGVLGGMAAAPTSFIAGPVAAAAGAAAGDAVRQNVAGYLDPGDPFNGGETAPYNWGQTALEAGLSGAGQFAGAAVNRMMAPNRLRVPSRDVGQVARDPAILRGAQQAQDVADAQGVRLSAGQSSGLPSLLTMEDAAMTNPATMDRARQFYVQQGQQMRGAADNMLSGISPIDDVTQASQAFREAAGEVPNNLRRAANRAARPAYQSAEQAGQVVTPDLAALMDNPVVEAAMTRARETYRIARQGAAPEVPDFSLWDLTRRELSDMSRTARAAGDRTRAGAMDDVLQRLTERLDDTFPSYAQARATAAPGQRLAATLEDTATGTAGAAGIDDRARSILAPIFERSNPQYVAQARQAFAQAGRMDEWNQGIRAYLQDAIQRASMSQQGLNPAMLRRQIWANVEDGVRANMSAAMTPAQFRGFENFMQTVEQVARTFPTNSLTAQRLGGQEALRAAGEDATNRALRAAGNVASPEVLSLARRGLNSIADFRNARNVSAVVDNLFSPDGLRFLEDMASLRPNTQRAILAVGQQIGRIGGATAATTEQTD